MKPIIGILSNITIPEIDEDNSIEKIFVNSSYVNAVIKSGGIPIIIPVNTEYEDIKSQIGLCNGILISGGIDVNPRWYNEEPLKCMGSFHPDIDEFDIYAIKIALENKIPILGICRGIQVLNVALGGTLYQDIDLVEGSYIKHMQKTKKYVGTHSIKIAENSKLREILGEEVYVNSYHHQCIKDVADAFNPVAYSKDKIVEAIEMKGDNFVIGVEWHPELMIDSDDRMMNLFKKMIESCKI